MCEKTLSTTSKLPRALLIVLAMCLPHKKGTSSHGNQTSCSKSRSIVLTQVITPRLDLHTGSFFNINAFLPPCEANSILNAGAVRERSETSKYVILPGKTSDEGWVPSVLRSLCCVHISSAGPNPFEVISNHISSTPSGFNLHTSEFKLKGSRIDG